jgi:hypothetical protein
MVGATGIEPVTPPRTPSAQSAEISCKLSVIHDTMCTFKRNSVNAPCYVLSISASRSSFFKIPSLSLRDTSIFLDWVNLSLALTLSPWT